MKVFVAGATGAIGRSLLPKLRAAGHEVTGMTRSEERAEQLQGEGFSAVVADAFDAAAVEKAVVAAAPEVVVHQLTSIPARLNPRKMAREFEVNDRLRIEGTRNLVAGARAADVRRIVGQSVAFAYDPSGEGLKTEDAPLYETGPAPFDRTVKALDSLETQVREAGDTEGVVLRYGFFYGPGTTYAPDGDQAKMVKARRLPVVGKGGGVFSFIHIDDAAQATVAATEGSTTGAFNVVDDEPAPWRDWLPVYAQAMGAKPPRRVPGFVARPLAGPVGLYYATRLRGASNEKAKRGLGWRPAHPTWRQGFVETAG